MYTKFQHTSLKIPDKTPTHFLMSTCNIGKEGKMDKIEKKAMTLGLNPTIQSLILHMYTIFEDSSLHNSGENCDTN